MHITDLITETRTSLTANPTRTLLTMLGIVIGIASVIAMLAVGQGTKASVEETVSSLGSNTLTITPGSSGGRPGAVASGNTQSLKLSDMEVIKKQVFLAKLVTAEVSAKVQVVAGAENVSVNVTGVGPEYREIKDINLEQGIFITENHNTGYSKVAILGAQTRDDLFGENSNPIGRKIKIKSNTYTIIGVAEQSGGGGFGGNADEAIYVPLTTAMQYLSGGDYVNSISIQANRVEDIDTIETQLRTLLLKRHKIHDPDLADFSIFNQAKIADSLSQITTALTLLLGFVAGISLIVGGIGIMNMMLTTVRERTREIGLRKALGADRKDISNQFLLESIVITCAGGIIGVLLGVGIALLVNFTGATQTKITAYSIILSFAVSGIIGISFGYYPAKKASELNPIEALRYE